MLVQAIKHRLLLGRRVVDDVLVVDRRIIDVGPPRLAFFALQLEPVAQRLQPPLQHPLRARPCAPRSGECLFVQTLGDSVFVNIGDEAPLVVLLRKTANCIGTDSLILHGIQPSNARNFCQ